MKRLFLVLLILPFIINANSYVNKEGNDGNGGTSWVDAWLTIDYAADNVSAAGDTIIVGWGTYAETISPGVSGAENNEIVLMDSADYENGFLVDSSWNVIINTTSECFNYNTNNNKYIKVVGLWAKGSTVQHIQAGSGNGSMWDNCKFSDHGDGNGNFYTAANNADSTTFTNCLFLANAGGVSYGLFMGTANTHLILTNNTFKGAYSLGVIWFSDGAATISNLKNNIVENDYSGGAGANLIRADDTSVVYDWDYNLWYDDFADDPWKMTVTINTFSDFQDSVLTWKTTGEGGVNSINSDPTLLNITTSCYIAKTSPAFNTGVNLGNRLSIGYYQPVVSQTIIIDF